MGTPSAGVPRGCVMVRFRTVGVAKSPLAMPMGPLRSRGMPGRGRRSASLRFPAWPESSGEIATGTGV
jgi:hypothetical protein